MSNGNSSLMLTTSWLAHRIGSIVLSWQDAQSALLSIATGRGGAGEISFTLTTTESNLPPASSIDESG